MSAATATNRPAFPKPECHVIPFETDATIYQSGINAALTRELKIEPESTEFLTEVSVNFAWRPHRPSVRTFGLTFPAGIEFLPTKKSDDAESAVPVPKPKKPATASDNQPKKRTRLKPPSDALSLEDRLFYVLQPPLETWLAGQELIMPFEPFPYQYEGIAWLFKQRCA